MKLNISKTRETCFAVQAICALDGVFKVFTLLLADLDPMISGDKKEQLW